MSLLTPLDIQHSTATQIWGVTDWYQSQGYREPGADNEEISEGDIPRVIVLGYDGLPMQPVAPPSPDYIPGPEDPQTPPPIYPKYIPLEDEHEYPTEEQPLPPVDSPTAESPGYVTESDPEKDPEEYEDDETEDGPVDYPMDGGDDGDDDDGDSSRDDANNEDEDEDKEDEEEEEEHLASAESAIVVPTNEPVSPPEGTELVIPPPSTDITIRARITRLARCPAPPAHSSPPLLPSLYIPPPVDRRDDILESEQPPHKRLCLSTLGSRYEVGESSAARPTKGRGTDYGFVSTVDVEERVIELAELHEHDTQDLYALLEDAQDSRSRISQRVDMDSQRVNLLIGDRMTLQETRRARQPALDARIPDHQDASRDADSHGIFKERLPKFLKNKDGGHDGNAQGWVYAVGNAEKRGNASGNPVSNVFMDHPFNIDLMPVELGSFDVIIGMDWLSRCHVVIVCDEKLVQVPYGNETLTFCGNESSNKRESRLAVISYSKAQEYMAKGFQVFLEQISAKKEEDKSEGKQIKDVPIVRDFPKVFLEDLPGLPPARPVEFQID
ncbi:putative reverse transcriptase domain-containing protein [Tanacetum coccineum]